MREICNGELDMLLLYLRSVRYDRYYKQNLKFTYRGSVLLDVFNHAEREGTQIGNGYQEGRHHERMEKTRVFPDFTDIHTEGFEGASLSGIYIESEIVEICRGIVVEANAGIGITSKEIQAQQFPLHFLVFPDSHLLKSYLEVRHGLELLRLTLNTS
ncbi:hypothetical protein QAD02_012518 [Eretmocerus hayati]|uniref:Uncharacterized protein n=1 Tax=Eretmocerus hayati TaxID=131215 RepID=A0ACC2NZX0_9HYME|nr:hypothetical protein QAD02_012518 [Eretmocerus hayati]